MQFYVEPVDKGELKPLYTDVNQLGFGKIFTDYMLTIKYSVDKKWHDAKIERYKNFSIDPAACVFHYSQEVFEGMKAYRTEDEQVLLFRPEQNARRLNRSASRLCMPEIPEEIFMQGLKELLTIEKHWIPQQPGTALYIRPTMVATEPYLGVHPAGEYLFYIILSPVGPYFKAGFNTISIYVEDTLVRAAVGGVGDIKTGGNYATQLQGQLNAQRKGYSQALWLDAKEHKYIEEVGAMNMFFVFGDKLVTPSLTGSILPGITRKSILELAKDMGYGVEERLISIDEAREAIANGEITEVFGSGTAAVISPVGVMHYQGQDYVINNNQVGEVTRAIYEKLINIQYGLAEDKFGWVVRLEDI